MSDLLHRTRTCDEVEEAYRALEAELEKSRQNHAEAFRLGAEAMAERDALKAELNAERIRRIDEHEKAKARVAELERAIEGYEKILEIVGEGDQEFHDDVQNIMSTMPVFAPWLRKGGGRESGKLAESERSVEPADAYAAADPAAPDHDKECGG